MSAHEEARAKAKAAYDAAADRYDDPANAFWERFGRRTVERIGLARGARVLDVCSGSGASAIPAAEAVGPEGSVLAVDLSGKLLALARAKAAARGLRHLEAREGDLLDLRVAPGSFDAAICVFGIFFVTDMAAGVRALWDALRPGGRLAITTWGPRFFEPATSAFWAAVRAERPELDGGFRPWERVVDPPSLRRVLAEAGVEGPEVAGGAEVVAEAGEHSIPSGDAWWAAVLGSGFRATIDRLEPAARERVRASNDEFLRRSGIRAVEANVVYALATKPGGGRRE